MKFLPFCLFLSVFILSSCSEGPKDNDDMIDESLIVNKEESGQRNYYIDSLKSFISWSGSNGDISHYGIVHIDNGYITITDSLLSGGMIRVRMSSIEVLDLRDNPADKQKLYEFLTSKEVFDVGNFPNAQFEIDSVSKISATGKTANKKSDFTNFVPTHTIYGKLSVRGTTRQIDFPVKIDMRYYRLQGWADFTLNSYILGIAVAQDSLNISASRSQVPQTIRLGLDIIAAAQ